MLLKRKVIQGKGSELSSIKKDNPVDLGAYSWEGKANPVDLGAYSWEGKAISKYLYATLPNLCKYESF